MRNSFAADPRCVLTKEDIAAIRACSPIATLWFEAMRSIASVIFEGEPHSIRSIDGSRSAHFARRPFSNLAMMVRWAKLRMAPRCGNPHSR